MYFEQISTAGDRNFGYLIADSAIKEAAVIDPSGAPEKFASRLMERGLKLVWLICTHHHHDHTNGSSELQRQFGTKLAMHESSPIHADEVLYDGQELPIGSILLRVVSTPGHTDDSICLYTPNLILTGDTLFVGNVGGTDFTEGARKQYDSLHHMLMTLPDDTKVYPGHDVGVRPFSTIGDEKQENPFLLQPDFNHFVKLKRNWSAYKAKHGIK